MPKPEIDTIDNPRESNGIDPDAMMVVHTEKSTCSTQSEVVRIAFLD